MMKKLEFNLVKNLILIKLNIVKLILLDQVNENIERIILLISAEDSLNVVENGII